MDKDIHEPPCHVCQSAERCKELGVCILSVPPLEPVTQPVGDFLRDAVSLRALYAEALDMKERRTLMRLAKSFYIRRQVFDRAMKCRQIEREIEAASNKAFSEIGKDLYSE